jgi:hypothetical protein
MEPNDLTPDFTGGPFTVAAARSAGISRRTLRGQRFRSPHRGTRVLAGAVTDERTAVAAALLVLPTGTLATGITGLRVLGVEIGTAEPLRFVAAHPRQIRRPGIRVTRVAVVPEAWDDLVVVPEHCWMVAALELNLLDLVIAGDWLLRLRLTSRRLLTAYACTSRSRGAGAARPALELIRERVDSPRESWLRICLVLAGLPTPECNPTIRASGILARVDLVYRQFRILIEYEGDQHRVDKTQWNLDIDRQESFTRDGWTIYRVTARRARHPREVVQRVYQLLVEAGYDGPPPVFDTRWRSLFE